MLIFIFWCHEIKKKSQHILPIGQNWMDPFLLMGVMSGLYDRIYTVWESIPTWGHDIFFNSYLRKKKNIMLFTELRIQSIKIQMHIQTYRKPNIHDLWLLFIKCKWSNLYVYYTERKMDVTELLLRHLCACRVISRDQFRELRAKAGEGDERKRVLHCVDITLMEDPGRIQNFSSALHYSGGANSALAKRLERWCRDNGYDLV